MPRADEGRAEIRFEAIGAPWQIETARPLPSSLITTIHKRIAMYDATYSRFRAGSLVSRIAEQPGEWTFPPDSVPLFALYRTLYEVTSGAVTPLVGRRLENLGYDREYTLRPQPTPVAIPDWDDVMSWDGRTLTTREPVVLDIGAAGKGYLVDIVADLLDTHGVDDYVVDASGDIKHRGPEPVRIALEHPLNPELAIGVYELQNGALCASAPGRRAWGTGLHHILDGLTGEPTTTVAATWAAAATGLESDGLATALFFASGELLAGSFHYDWLRMFPDSRVEHNQDFPGELFT